MQVDEQFSRDLDAVRSRLESLANQAGKLSREGRESAKAAVGVLCWTLRSIQTSVEASPEEAASRQAPASPPNSFAAEANPDTATVISGLEALVAARTAELEEANDLLLAEVAAKEETARALQASEERYRVLVECADELICTVDRAGRFLFLNAPGAKRLETKSGNLVGKTLHDVLPKDAADEHLARVHAVMDTGRAMNSEVAIALRKGEKWFHLSLAPIADDQGISAAVLVIGRDITERRAAEEALRASQSLYSTTIETMTDPIHVVDRGLRITLFNNAFREWCERLKIPPARAGQDLFDAFPFLPPQVRIEYEKVYQTGELLTTRERTVVGGEEVITETRKIPVLENGRTARIITMVQDITESSRREQALRESEERFRGIFESSSDCIMVFNPELFYLYANQAALNFVVNTRRLVGQEPKPEFLENGLTGLHVRRSLAHVPAFCDLCVQRLEYVFDKGVVLPLVDAVEMGTRTVYSESTAMPLKDREGNVFAVGVIHRDITERKLDEQELERSRQQLRDLAARLAEAEEAERRRLAGELHDQIGQTVTAIGMNLNYLRCKIPDESPSEVPKRLEDAVALVEDAAQRVRDVMAELRPPVLDDYGFTSALRWYAEQFYKRHGLLIELETVELQPRLSLEVETALFRIVQEACNNAVKHASPAKISISFREAGESRVILTVSDTGAGFEPGRVRNPGRHSGWGLIIMRERAAAVGAEFDLASAPGEGTTVTVTVPRQQD